MRIIAVFNKDGGTFRSLDVEAFSARAVEIAAHGGAMLQCRAVSAADLTAELEQAAIDPDVDAIMAGGGDGTISAAAAVCFRHGKPLAVLPAGTMNLVARMLRMPLDLEPAIAAIASGRFYDIDIATANGRPFLHQFSVGLHARLVQAREKIDYSNRWQKMFASVRAVASAVSRRLRFDTELISPAGTKRRLACGISVSNNLLGEGHIPHADRVDAGVLGVYVAKPMSALRTAWFCVRVLVGHWKDYLGVSEDKVTDVTLRFARLKKNAVAAIDGELIPLEPHVHLKIHPRGLRVLAPQALADVLLHDDGEADKGRAADS